MVGFAMAPRNLTTEAWAVKQLRKMDWVVRHHHLKALEQNKPNLHEKICDMMGADEAILGRSGGFVIDSRVVIMAKDRVGGKATQVTLHRWLKKKES